MANNDLLSSANDFIAQAITLEDSLNVLLGNSRSESPQALAHLHPNDKRDNYTYNADGHIPFWENCLHARDTMSSAARHYEESDFWNKRKLQDILAEGTLEELYMVVDHIDEKLADAAKFMGIIPEAAENRKTEQRILGRFEDKEQFIKNYGRKRLHDQDISSQDVQDMTEEQFAVFSEKAKAVMLQEIDVFLTSFGPLEEVMQQTLEAWQDFKTAAAQHLRDTGKAEDAELVEMDQGYRVVMVEDDKQHQQSVQDTVVAVFGRRTQFNINSNIDSNHTYGLQALAFYGDGYNVFICDLELDNGQSIVEKPDILINLLAETENDKIYGKTIIYSSKANEMRPQLIAMGIADEHIVDKAEGPDKLAQVLAEFR